MQLATNNKCGEIIAFRYGETFKQIEDLGGQRWFASQNPKVLSSWLANKRPFVFVVHTEHPILAAPHTIVVTKLGRRKCDLQTIIESDDDVDISSQLKLTSNLAGSLSFE